MDISPELLEERRDIALYETFRIDGVAFGFTTIMDDDQDGYLSWIFYGDCGGDEDEPGILYVMGKVQVSKHAPAVLLTTWFPRPSLTLFTPFQ